MSEIKVGEYVRTTDGYIGKLVEITNALNYYKIDVGREIQHMNYIKDNYIYSRDGFGHKHSSNIIDLIELGDFVNKQEVVNVEGFDKNGDDKEELGIIDIDGDYAYGVFLEDIPIKTIVTHEQMEQMEYKV